MDVFVEVVQNPAVHAGQVTGGLQVLLGPLQLTVEPCHPILQQTAGVRGHTMTLQREKEHQRIADHVDDVMTVLDEVLCV